MKNQKLCSEREVGGYTLKPEDHYFYDDDGPPGLGLFIGFVCGPICWAIIIGLIWFLFF